MYCNCKYSRIGMEAKDVDYIFLVESLLAIKKRKVNRVRYRVGSRVLIKGSNGKFHESRVGHQCFGWKFGGLLYTRHSWFH